LPELAPSDILPFGSIVAFLSSAKVHRKRHCGTTPTPAEASQKLPFPFVRKRFFSGLMTTFLREEQKFEHLYSSLQVDKLPVPPRPCESWLR